MNIKLIIVTLLIASGTASAQSTFWSKFNAGFSFGSNQSIIQSSLEEKSTNNTSFSFGAQFLYKVNDLLTVESGILRTNFNFTTITSLQAGESTFKNQKHVHLTYLNIPLQARWYIQNDRLDIFAISGINNLILTNDYQINLDNSGIEYRYEDVDYTSKKLSTGLTVGAGINYNLTYRASFGLSGMYTLWSNKTIKDIKSMRSLSILPTIYYQF